MLFVPNVVFDSYHAVRCTTTRTNQPHDFMKSFMVRVFLPPEVLNVVTLPVTEKKQSKLFCKARHIFDQGFVAMS